MVLSPNLNVSFYFFIFGKKKNLGYYIRKVILISSTFFMHFIMNLINKIRRKYKKEGASS